MKKTFYGLGRIDGQYQLLEYHGDIIKYRDLSLGVQKEGGVLTVVELSTGLSIFRETNEIKYKKDLIPFLDNGRYEIIRRLMEFDDKQYSAKIYNELLKKVIKNA